MFSVCACLSVRYRHVLVRACALTRFSFPLQVVTASSVLPPEIAVDTVDFLAVSVILSIGLTVYSYTQLAARIDSGLSMVRTMVEKVDSKFDKVDSKFEMLEKNQNKMQLILVGIVLLLVFMSPTGSGSSLLTSLLGKIVG